MTELVVTDLQKIISQINALPEKEKEKLRNVMETGKLYTHQREYFEDLWKLYDSISMYMVDSSDIQMAKDVAANPIAEKYIECVQVEKMHQFIGFFLGYTYAYREKNNK